MKRGLGKLGLICLALVLALALCGIGYAHWSDMVTIEGRITTGEWESGGTIGFWKNWDRHKTFEQDDIEDWLVSINAASCWLGPITVEGMEDILWQKCKSDMKCKFLKQYLATRLNGESGLLSPTSTHDVTGIDETNYLGLADPESATLSQIITTVEGKYPNDLDNPDEPADPDDGDALWPTKDEYEIMKDICDDLNNTGGIYPHL